MTRQQTIETFLEALSSRQPVPGGGGASAFAGALGTALGLMVGNLTVGKKKYAAVEADVSHMMERLEGLQREMVALIDEDARVFAPLAAAYGLPAGTQEERAHKDRVMEENLLHASLVPLKIMELAVEVLGILEELEEKGGFVVEELAERIFEEKPELKVAFQDKMEKYDLVKEEILPQSETTTRKYQKQHLLTDTGIEIKIPMEQYKNPGSVEFITNPDGTVSVLIKNIGHLEARF